MNYKPKLDTLRGIAAISVMAFHYSDWFGWGWMGVPLFFVMSGYLITTILLQSKATSSTLGGFLRDFFVRRLLRLLPVYVLFLIAEGLYSWTAHEPSKLISDLPYLLTYTFNFRIVDQAVREYPHLWSLSVEWQFYLLWPFAVWFLSKRTLKWTLVVLVCAAPVLRLLSVQWFIRHGFDSFASAAETYFITSTHFDVLAYGALLAWTRPRDALGRRSVTLLISGVVLCAGALVAAYGYNDGYWKLTRGIMSFGYPLALAHFDEYVWGYTILGLLFAAIVATSLRSDQLRGPFQWEWLRYVGKISYGFYVFHVAGIHVVMNLLRRADLQAPPETLLGRVWRDIEPVIGLAACFGLTLLFAHLSYQLWEIHFLRLKSRRGTGDPTRSAETTKA